MKSGRRGRMDDADRWRHGTSRDVTWHPSSQRPSRYTGNNNNNNNNNNKSNSILVDSIVYRVFTEFSIGGGNDNNSNSNNNNNNNNNNSSGSSSSRPKGISSRWPAFFVDFVQEVVFRWWLFGSWGRSSGRCVLPSFSLCLLPGFGRNRMGKRSRPRCVSFLVGKKPNSENPIKAAFDRQKTKKKLGKPGKTKSNERKFGPITR